mmetsp:Transcript_52384/g.114201  ORF Transcript_52384/g.114201 Transcript_52384/m.114201 type:complete len:219 (-) Transcript_52384:193-849(-)
MPGSHPLAALVGTGVAPAPRLPKPGLNVIVPGSAMSDGSPNEGIQPSHSRLTTAASTRKNGGPYGGSTPTMRRSTRCGSAFRSTLSRGPRQPEVRSKSDVHTGVSCSIVVSKIDPVPSVIASCAVSLKAMMLSSGRPRSARAATAKAMAAKPRKSTAITSVPQKCSTSVAARRTHIDAHSHSTPSITPYKKASKMRHMPMPNMLRSLCSSLLTQGLGG